MSYKKIISFINGENEAGSNIVAKAERCCHAGADEIFLYNYSKIEEDRNDFLTTLRQVAGAIDIPFFVGMYIGRFEDAKKALYTGAEKLVIKYDILPEQEVLSEIIARFGSDRLMLEIDAGKEFESIDLDIDTFLIKHVDGNQGRRTVHITEHVSTGRTGVTSPTGGHLICGCAGVADVASELEPLERLGVHAYTSVVAFER